MIQITKTSDQFTKKNIINRISDIPGGVSLVLATLIVGNVIQEGTPLSVPTDGKRSVCKSALVLATSTTTVIKVTTGMHNFKVGDFIGTKVGGKAYAITTIVTTDGVDAITVGTAIDAPVTGGYVYQMAAEAATDTSALLNDADVILAFPFIVPVDTQVIWMADAQLRADVVEDSIADLYLAQLDVNEVKY